MTKPAFQPAPRPRPRTSPEEARQLASAAEDLGFTRPSHPPEAERARGPEGESAPAPKGEGAKAQTPKAPFGQKGPALKLTISDDLWTELRRKALDERVTVKYLVLRALARDGFNVDLDAIPEDGRRLR